MKNKIIQSIGFIVTIFVSQNLFADTLYVSKTGGHVSPFGSLVDAATNIQAAVDAAAESDIVLVNDGIYYPGNEISVFKNITVKSINGAENTIVDGNNSHRCFNLSDNTILNGFIIINGLANNIAGNSGGAVSGGIVRYCTITGNPARFGGGISDSIVQNCIIARNSASESGGGIFWSTVQNCIISGNSASESGGGACEGTLQNCIISGNSATNGGGVSGGIVQNCIISGNSATNGGGVSEGKVQNCTITGNSARKGGGIIAGHETINNNIIYNNHAEFYPNYYINNDDVFEYNCTTPLPFVGIGNITDNPILFDSGHISLDSPCVGAGKINYSIGVDIDGDSWQNPPAIGCDQPVTGLHTGKLSVSIFTKYNKITTGYSNYFFASILGNASQNLWSFDTGVTWENTLGGFYSWDTPETYKVILKAFNETYPAGVSATVIVEVVEKQIYYVNKNNPSPVPPYIFWETAATNIQAAVDVTENLGDIVLVTNGTYYLTNEITITNNNNIIVKSVNGAANTIIDGNNAVRCFYLNSENTIDGFTITNGTGGVYCPYGGIIKNCIINGNSANSYGGGVRCFEGGLIQNCTISGNSARWGGGVFFNDGGIIQNCMISENSAFGSGGGGIYFSGGGIHSCTISGNSTSSSGGGVYFAGNGIIQSCIISENSAGFNSGGVSSSSGNKSLIQDCTITENSAFNGIGGVSCYTIQNCTINKNSARWGGGIDCNMIQNCIISGNSAYDGDDGGGFGKTIQNCTITENSASGDGGGVWFETIQNCTISKNSALGNGGGAIIRAGSAGTVMDCTITENSAHSGGGLYNINGGTVQSCTISENTATANGGGIFCEDTLIKNCKITENLSGDDDDIFLDYSGGGIYIYSSGIVYNCTIALNSADFGGGIDCREGVTVQNCTIIGNSAKYGSGINCEEESTIMSSILWNNINGNYFSSDSFNLYNCIENWLVIENGIITNNPEFVNVAAGNYRLESFSPCINSGINTDWMWAATDLDGTRRIVDGIVDMGAYEYIPEPSLFLIFNFIFFIYYLKR